MSREPKKRGRETASRAPDLLARDGTSVACCDLPVSLINSNETVESTPGDPVVVAKRSPQNRQSFEQQLLGLLMLIETQQGSRESALR